MQLYFTYALIAFQAEWEPKANKAYEHVNSWMAISTVLFATATDVYQHSMTLAYLMDCLAYDSLSNACMKAKYGHQVV